MSVELRANDAELTPGNGAGPSRPETPGSLERRRPNVSGDLRTVLGSAPIFRRAVGGYDRLQVDTYVQWAEDELATAGREREHLLIRYAQMHADFVEARRLLSHSPGGRESVRMSRRIESMLATAADQAEAMRAEAEADRADARAEAERLVASAAAEAERMLSAADAMVAEAEQIAREARAEAEVRLEKLRELQRRTTEDAERARQKASTDASIARMQARDDVLRLLTAGAEQRRRSDAEAAAIRERLDRDAAARRADLLAEVAELERRHALARAGLERMSELVTRSLAALADPAPAGDSRDHELQVRRDAPTVPASNGGATGPARTGWGRRRLPGALLQLGSRGRR